jgi:hypothetical protein
LIFTELRHAAADASFHYAIFTGQIIDTPLFQPPDSHTADIFADFRLSAFTPLIVFCREAPMASEIADTLRIADTSFDIFATTATPLRQICFQPARQLTAAISCQPADRQITVLKGLHS